MNPAIEGIQLVINIALLLLFWKFCWRRYSVDVARQNLFAIRNELFDVAASDDNSLEFNSPEYVLLRRWIHATIRLTESFEGLHMVLYRIAKPPSTKQDALELAIKQVKDGTLRKSLRRIKNRCALEMIWHLLRTSPLFWLGILAELAYRVLLRRAFVVFKQWKSLALPSVVKILDYELSDDMSEPVPVAA